MSTQSELAASLRAQERGIGHTLRAREIEAVARWIESWPGTDDDPLCQCQGCGAYRSISWLGKAHACYRAEDGTYEEGGTFQ